MERKNKRVSAPCKMGANIRRGERGEREDKESLLFTNAGVAGRGK